MNTSATPLALDFAAALDATRFDEVSVLPGRTYDRVITTDAAGERGIIGFVRRTDGVLLAPASWGRPSLNRPSFDLHTQISAAVAANKS